MPGFDRTGPLGQGPMTGRGMGPCGSGYARGFGRGAGFGRGLGRGMGRGFRRGFAPAWGYSPYGYEPTKDQEIADLRAEKEALQEELKQLERLKELESKK